MKRFATMILMICTAMLLLAGCASLGIERDDDVQSGGQALEVSQEDCKQQCQEQFHECRGSEERGGGPGASGCAHEKNSCEKSC